MNQHYAVSVGGRNRLVSLCLNRQMAPSQKNAERKPDTPITALRRRLLRELIEEEYGGRGDKDAFLAGVKAFAKVAKKPWTQINDMAKSGGKPFGADIARQLESAVPLPKFYFDGGGGWPFAIDYERYKTLPRPDKLRVEGAVLSIILDSELRRGVKVGGAEPSGESVESNGRARTRAAS